MIYFVDKISRRKQLGEINPPPYDYSRIGSASAAATVATAAAGEGRKPLNRISYIIIKNTYSDGRVFRNSTGNSNT